MARGKLLKCSVSHAKTQVKLPTKEEKTFKNCTSILMKYHGVKMHYRSNSSRSHIAHAHINKSIQLLCVVLTESIRSSFAINLRRTAIGKKIKFCKDLL